MAHDLQSPIYGVRNALRAAAAAIHGDRISGPEIVSALAVMEDTCSTLAERVASLLVPQASGSSVATADARADVATILRKIASAHRLSMDGKGATLRFSGDGSLQVWPADKIEHILDILVDNAIKYSTPGSPVEIAADSLGSQVEIKVTDGGRGIAPGDVKHLFRPRAAAQRDANGPGVGLGLYLASEQASGLGGELTYAPAQPRGSTFRLVVPA